MTTAQSCSVVYVVTATDSDLVKIGTTTNLKLRLKAIATNCAGDVNVLRVLQGGKPAERWMHERFASQHVGREWFRFHPDMLVATPDVGLADLGLNGDCAGAIAPSELLKRAWPKNTIRKAAEASGQTQRTTERWTCGRVSMSASALLTMASRSPAFRWALRSALDEMDMGEVIRPPIKPHARRAAKNADPRPDSDRTGAGDRGNVADKEG